MRCTWMLLLVGAVVVAGCHTITEDLPQNGTTSNPNAPAPVELTPTPTPERAPTATPTPEPTPTPAPPSATCSPGTGAGIDCPRTSPSFLDQVDAAIDQLAEQHPELFRFNDMRGDKGWYVRDGEAYHEGVAANLRAMGLCAIFDGEEIAVKRGNGFSDQYDIHLSTGHVRRGEGSYRATCRPAWF